MLQFQNNHFYPACLLGYGWGYDISLHLKKARYAHINTIKSSDLNFMDVKSLSNLANKINKNHTAHDLLKMPLVHSLTESFIKVSEIEPNMLAFLKDYENNSKKFNDYKNLLLNFVKLQFARNPIMIRYVCNLLFEDYKIIENKKNTVLDNTYKIFKKLIDKKTIFYMDENQKNIIYLENLLKKLQPTFQFPKFHESPDFFKILIQNYNFFVSDSFLFTKLKQKIGFIEVDKKILMGDLSFFRINNSIGESIYLSKLTLNNNLLNIINKFSLVPVSSNRFLVSYNHDVDFEIIKNNKDFLLNCFNYEQYLSSEDIILPLNYNDALTQLFNFEPLNKKMYIKEKDNIQNEFLLNLHNHIKQNLTSNITNYITDNNLTFANFLMEISKHEAFNIIYSNDKNTPFPHNTNIISEENLLEVKSIIEVDLGKFFFFNKYSHLKYGAKIIFVIKQSDTLYIYDKSNKLFHIIDYHYQSILSYTLYYLLPYKHINIIKFIEFKKLFSLFNLSFLDKVLLNIFKIKLPMNDILRQRKGDYFALNFHTY